VLRGARKALRALFESSGLSAGKHHWVESTWLIKVTKFLEEYLGIEATHEEKCAVALLLYHSLGPSKEKSVSSDSIIYQALGAHGMVVFKLIFDNNNQELVGEFFTSPLIQKLWPHIQGALAYEHCFETGYPDFKIWRTYGEISKKMRRDFGLPMPEWWETGFDQ
jgi:hypothetical protein